MKKRRETTARGQGARGHAPTPLAGLGAARRHCWGRLTRFLERRLWRPPGECGQQGPRESGGGQARLGEGEAGRRFLRIERVALDSNVAAGCGREGLAAGGRWRADTLNLSRRIWTSNERE